MKFASIFTFCLLLPSTVFAGPGGKIAKAVFETFWGRMLLGILIVVLLPLIAWVAIKEHFAKKRALKHLGIVGSALPDFQWIKIRKRVKDCFTRVHDSWDKTDVSAAADWMTPWYWQNQQLVYLDRWEREGLVNCCEVFKIKKMFPILFSYQSEQDQPGEGSELAVIIEAKMTDYLMRKSDGKVIEGSTRKKDVERIWSFTFENGQWLVSDIDEGSNSLAYVDMMKNLPAIADHFPSGRDVAHSSSSSDGEQ
jgi:hypothetical protein